MIILHYFKEVAEFYAQEMTEIFQETAGRGSPEWKSMNSFSGANAASR